MTYKENPANNEHALVVYVHSSNFYQFATFSKANSNMAVNL